MPGQRLSTARRWTLRRITLLPVFAFAWWVAFAGHVGCGIQIPIAEHVLGRRYKVWSAIVASERELSNWTGPLPSCFAVRTFQRLGNNVVQLIRVLTYCDVLGVREVYVAKNFLFFQRTFVAGNGVTVHVGESWNSHGVAAGHFFTPLLSVVRYNFRLVCGFFRDEFLKGLPHPNVSAELLYLHLRGGDIFSTFVHYLYAQPPCSYYLDAIKLDDAREAELVSEDSANPCFQLLKERGLRHVRGGVAWDFARLVYARRLVVSSSSFCRAAVALSPVAKQLYTFNYPWRDFGSHWNCVPERRFRELVMRNWTNSPDQVALIRNSSCFWMKVGLSMGFVQRSRARQGVLT